MTAMTSCSCHSTGHGHRIQGAPVIALVGAPNAGKSTLFNGLTGARAHMGNWPGTTVEVSRGAWKVNGTTYDVIDFPGAYSLDPVSPDEALTRNLVIDTEERPDAVIVAVDAASRRRPMAVRRHGVQSGGRTHLRHRQRACKRWRSQCLLGGLHR